MPKKAKEARRLHSLILTAELAKIESGQKESNLALVYRAIRKAKSGDVSACKMIFDRLDEPAGQINENESKQERQCTDYPANLEDLSMAELQRLYMDEMNRSRRAQN